MRWLRVYPKTKCGTGFQPVRPTAVRLAAVVLFALAPGLGWSAVPAAPPITTTRPSSRPASQPTSSPASQTTTSRATTQAASKPASQPTTQPTKPKDRYLAVTGGVVHPISSPDLRGVTILCKNGKIVEIGRHVDLPEDTEVIDAAGLHVYPGLVASDTRGIVGSEPPEDNTDVFSTNMRLANAAGLTTVVVGNAAAKVTFGTLDGIVLREDLFIKLQFRTAGQRRQIREALEKVRRYLREKETYERKKAEAEERGEEVDKAEPPDDSAVKGKNAKYLQLIKKEKAALIEASARSDLLAVCRLATAFGIRVVVRGASEGWTVPDALGRAGIKVVVSPRRLPRRNEQKNQPTGGSIENAAILYSHGVDLAVTTPSTGISLVGLAGRDLMNLPMAAAYAVRGGLPEKAAIASVTLAAARVAGIDDRVGSIELGKDADFILCDGALLDFFTTVQKTVINGRVAFDKTQESLFAHIRPRTPTTQPAKFKFWPRRFKPIISVKSEAGDR